MTLALALRATGQRSLQRNVISRGRERDRYRRRGQVNTAVRIVSARRNTAGLKSV